MFHILDGVFSIDIDSVDLSLKADFVGAVLHKLILLHFEFNWYIRVSNSIELSCLDFVNHSIVDHINRDRRQIDFLSSHLDRLAGKSQAILYVLVDVLLARYLLGLFALGQRQRGFTGARDDVLAVLCVIIWDETFHGFFVHLMHHLLYL